MKITSLDIRKQEFARTFRGYDVDEVDSFLQVVSTGWQEMVDELRRSGDKVQEQQLKLEHYMKVEEALEEALQTARTSARQTVESAEKKASSLLEEAENRVVEMQRDADTNRLEVKRETARYAVRQQEIVAKLRSFLMSEMEMLHHFESETGEHTLTSAGSRKEIELVKDESPTPTASLGPEEEVVESAVSENTEEASSSHAEGSTTATEEDVHQSPDVEESATSDGDDLNEAEMYFESEEETPVDASLVEGDESEFETERDSPAWTVTPVFESVEDPESGEEEKAATQESSSEKSDDFADEEIKKIHEILKGLDEEQDGESD